MEENKKNKLTNILLIFVGAVFYIPSIAVYLIDYTFFGYKLSWWAWSANIDKSIRKGYVKVLTALAVIYVLKMLM